MEGHSIDKRQLRFVISSCRLSGVYSWINLPWVAEGFFVFVLFWIAALPLTVVAKQNKINPLAPREVHAEMRLVQFILENHKKSGNHFGCQKEIYFKTYPDIFIWTDERK